MLQAISIGAPASGPSGWTGYSGVWNSADKTAGTTLSLGDRLASAAAGNNSARSTPALATKSWCNFIFMTNADAFAGVANATETLTNYPGQTTNSIGFDGEDGNLYYNAGVIFDGAICSQYDQITIARNGVNYWFARNGVWFQGDPILGTSPFVTTISGDVYFMGPRNVDSILMVALPTGFAP